MLPATPAAVLDDAEHGNRAGETRTTDGSALQQSALTEASPTRSWRRPRLDQQTASPGFS